MDFKTQVLRNYFSLSVLVLLLASSIPKAVANDNFYLLDVRWPKISSDAKFQETQEKMLLVSHQQQHRGLTHQHSYILVAGMKLAITETADGLTHPHVCYCHY